MVGLAMVVGAAVSAVAAQVTIVASGNGVGSFNGELKSNAAVEITWTFNTDNVPADSNSSADVTEHSGTGWLSVAITVDGAPVEVGSSADGYIGAASSLSDGDVLAFFKTNVAVDLFAPFKAVFPAGTPSLVPADWDTSLGGYGLFLITFPTLDMMGSLSNLAVTVETIDDPADPTPAELLEQLSDDLGAMNLDRGTANSLDSKLDAVLASLLDPKRKDNKTAINQLSAFINSVKALRGKKVPTADADNLIQQAEAIIAALSS